MFKADADRMASTLEQTPFRLDDPTQAFLDSSQREIARAEQTDPSFDRGLYDAAVRLVLERLDEDDDEAFSL
ncbi:hypothetical protein [Magnetofaba australis]|nr:hypothetical protein [Magnetofaba australis]